MSLVWSDDSCGDARLQRRIGHTSGVIICQITPLSADLPQGPSYWEMLCGRPRPDQRAESGFASTGGEGVQACDAAWRRWKVEAGWGA